MRRSNPLQIIGCHGHRWGIERGLDVQRHEDAEEDRIDVVVMEQWQKDRHENDDDLGPFERPAEQEDDDLSKDEELYRGQVERQHELLNDGVSPEIGEHRREGPGADEEVADHRRRARGEIDRFLQAFEGECAIGRRQQ